MFGFGFLFLLVMTQIHGLGLAKRLDVYGGLRSCCHRIHSERG